MGRGRGKAERILIAPPPPLSSLPSVAHLLGTFLQDISFSPLTFPCYKIKDGNYNFKQDNTEPSAAKITLALQATNIIVKLTILRSISQSISQSVNQFLQIMHHLYPSYVSLSYIAL